MFPITSVAGTRELESAAVEAGLTYTQLQETAGRALSQSITNLSREHKVAKGPLLVLAGPGHNGNDGLICALAHHDRGERVYVYVWNRDPNAKDPLIEALRDAEIEVAYAQNDSPRYQLRRWLRLSSWCLDALLGIGSNRPLAGVLAEILDTVSDNRTPALKLCAADCPTGLNCDTGEADPRTPMVDFTVMLGVAKIGLYKQRAGLHCGQLSVADIGIPAELGRSIPTQGVNHGDLRGLLPARDDLGHKGSHGRALCVVGSLPYPGAAYLSAYAVAKSGTGLVRVAVPDAVLNGLVPLMPDVTFLPLPHAEGAVSYKALPALRQIWGSQDAILLGSGLYCSDGTTRFVQRFLQMLEEDGAAEKIPLVLDADALNCLARIPDWPALLPTHAILTPHMGEMERLCPQDVRELTQAAPDLVRRKAAEWNCTILLKGHRTLLATPAGRVYVLFRPNSALATAGTGDVLAGLITSFLAQGQPPEEAALGALLIHSRLGAVCADQIGAAGTVASDLLRLLPAVLREEYARP